MDREEFKEYIIAGKTIPQLQEIYGLSRTKIAMYKKEFGFVGLTPNSKRVNREDGIKICPKCNKELPLTEFYSNGYNSTGSHKYKSACIKCENSTRKNSFYNKIVEYLNSCNKDYSCERCNYTGIYGSLDFHHVNPKDKEFTIGGYSNSTISQERFDEEIMPELDKCILLCPNCHRQEHLIMCPT